MQIALQVGRALGHIHQKNIVHRDIKPENIRVDPAGRAKLMDFGIAKADGMPPTKAGFTVGTPYYMAPEQVLGEDVTIQADVYSFGVLMYELFTGKKPVEAETSEKIFHKVLYEPLNLEPLHEAAVVPAAIDLVSRCMAKAPADRPQGLGIVCGGIGEILKQGALQPRPAPAEPAGKPVSGDDELPEFLQAFPAPLRTQGGLALLGDRHAGSNDSGVLRIAARTDHLIIDATFVAAFRTSGGARFTGCDRLGCDRRRDLFVGPSRGRGAWNDLLSGRSLPVRPG